MPTLDEIIRSLRHIKNSGWVNGGRPGNDGSVGNTLEDLLGIDENNLSAPDIGDFELKTRSLKSIANVSLFHMEPHPREERFVPRVLLPDFGWPHPAAGIDHPYGEMSFRLTLRGQQWTNRGFRAIIDHHDQTLRVEFDSEEVDDSLRDWLVSVLARRGTLDGLLPAPMWELAALYEKSVTKLGNTIFCQAEERQLDGRRQFRYLRFDLLFGFDFSTFLTALENGAVVTEFDARTGHNHGTKFRVPAAELATLFSHRRQI